MRIYSTKTYIVWPANDEHKPQLIDGQSLRQKIKSAELFEGDAIYEATEFARVKEKRSVMLLDASGAPVMEEEAETGEKAPEKPGDVQKELDKLSDPCPRCGELIPNGDKACPTCGSLS